MRIKQTIINGVYVVETDSIQDHRGSFTRLYCGNELEAIIGNRKIVQINHSRTKAIGAVRGMHYQNPPHAEMKLIRCIRGRVWDVALDLRKDSKTFLKWYAEELSPENARMMVIPEGCAHGFQVLDEDSELLYLHTSFYAPESEGGIRFDDPIPGIKWPIPFTDISQRDKNHPLINAEFTGIQL